MKIKVIYNYMEGYLPTKRCRKLRYREAKKFNRCNYSKNK